MTTKFLYPDPTRDKVMEELDRLVAVLDKPKNPEIEKNIRFLRNFTKSLFMIAHKKPLRPKFSRIIEEHRQLESSKPIEIKQETKPLPPKILPPPPLPSPKPISLPPKMKLPEIEKNNIIQLKKENNTLIYDVVEPRMESMDWQIYNELKPVIQETIKKNPNIIQDQNFIPSEIQKIAKRLKIKYSPDYARKIKYYLEKNLKGYGKLDPLIRDNRVRKIICNSYDDIKVVFESETLPTNIEFDSNEELNNFIVNLAERNGRKISELEPYLEIKNPIMEVRANYSPLTTSSFTITKIS
ncbi:MAG TPA: hypothetical protein VJH20_03175 [Candidatus Nanoarchaeia archaeon]|nr:hypothetical protein [Candidatus Nanoarchaeia archaeon]